MAISENKHTSNIIWIKWDILSTKYVYTSTCIDPYIYAYKYTHVHTCAYIHLFRQLMWRKKETTNLKEIQEGYMQGFEKRKGKGEM